MTRTQFTNDSDSSAGQISIRISPYIEREFKRRDIFHELRLEKAYRTFSGTGDHMVSVERAREILADANANRYNRDQPRGMSVAYGSLARNIDEALREEARQGLIQDPGEDAVISKIKAATRKAPTAKTAKIYRLETKNRHEGAIENRLDALIEKASEGDIHGMTYVITNKDGMVEFGRIGLHRQNKAIALGTMLQAAVALVMTP